MNQAKNVSVVTSEFFGGVVVIVGKVPTVEIVYFSVVVIIDAVVGDFIGIVPVCVG